MTLFSKETEFQDETFSKLDLENKIIKIAKLYNVNIVI